MKIPADTNHAFNLIAVGAWNPAIFSPQWIKQHLAPDPGQDVVMAIPMQAMAFPRLTVDGVNIYPTAQNYVMDCVELNDESLGKVATYFTRICELLPHTPVSALGLNFRFLGNIADEPQLAELFGFSDAASIDATAYVLKAAAVKRSFALNDGTKLNFSVDSNAADFLIEFNFHADVSGPVEAALRATPEILTGRRQQAVDFLRTTYDIELD